MEGETILVLGGLDAHQGYLKLIGVIIAGFAGSLMSNQLFFFLERRHSRFILHKRLAWRLKFDWAEHWIPRYESAAILSLRFSVRPANRDAVCFGHERVRIWKFAILHIIGALVWAAVIGRRYNDVGRDASLKMGKNE